MTEAKKTKRADFTEGPLFIQLIKFSLPLMATGLLQSLYNASDMIVVGKFSPSGDNAMGAVGACSALINLLLNLFIGLATGAGVIVAQNIGAKKYKDVKDTVDTSVVASLVCGCVLALIGFFAAEPLLILMGTPETLIDEATLYMKAHFMGAPASIFYNFMASILRSSGDSKRPLVFLSVSGLVNVLLNLVMCLVFGMGAVGVGIATAASQYVAAVMIFVYMTRADTVCKISRENFKVNMRKLWLIIKIGVPTGLQGMLFSISNVLMQSSINAYGDVVVNGNSAAANIESFVYVAMNAMYHCAITFVAQNVGARKYERVKKVIWQSSLIVAVVGVFLGVGVRLFADPLLSIYASKEIVREAGIRRITMICLPYFLCGLMDVGCGAVRGMGKTVLPMIVSLTGSCLLRIVWIKYIYEPMFLGNIYMLYACYAISWIITALAHYVCTVVLYKKMKQGNISLLTDEKREIHA